MCFPQKGIDDLRLTIYDAAAALKKTSLGQVSVMGEMIPHSFLLVESAIHAKRQELHDLRKLPIMHKSEYEALVLDIIKNDPQDIEDTNDLREVTQFMHERGTNWPGSAPIEQGAGTTFHRKGSRDCLEGPLKHGGRQQATC